MKAYLLAVNLLVHAHHNPESLIAEGLAGVPTPDRRKHAGTNSGLIDWTVADDDIASCIAAVSLPDDYTPGEPVIPLWPAGTVR